MDLCEFEDSLVYTASYRTARDIQRDPASNKQTKSIQLNNRTKTNNNSNKKERKREKERKARERNQLLALHGGSNM